MYEQIKVSSFEESSKHRNTAFIFIFYNSSTMTMLPCNLPLLENEERPPAETNIDVNAIRDNAT